MVKGLTFDVFGTVFDLRSSFEKPVREFFRAKGVKLAVDALLGPWRDKQRELMMANTLMMKGHLPFKTISRRALMHSLEKIGVKAKEKELDELMKLWYELKAFPDANPALKAMKERGYKLSFLTNGDNDIVQALARRLQVKLDSLCTAEEVGVYKPHPRIYLEGAKKMGLHVGEIIHVASHLFDIYGAKAAGMMAVYVNRHSEPREPSDNSPDFVVGNFHEILPLLK